MEAASKPIQIAIGLIWHEGRVLVGKRAQGCPLAGCDEFPGGKCHEGESAEVAVVRECLEETGLHVEVQRLRLRVVHTYPHGTLDISFFDCVPRDVPSAQGELRWVSPMELAKLRFPEANRELVEELIRSS